MKERPILFNGKMVKAILAGRKTQTRRVMKRQPEPSKTREGDFWFSCDKMQTMVHVSDFSRDNPYMPDAHEFFSACCPIGAVGDQLWVRETWARYNIEQDSHDVAYRATKPDDWPTDGLWRPSIHMPRWASRIDLLITGVRVERLQDISEEDAQAEGVTSAMWLAEHGVKEEDWENLDTRTGMQASHKNGFATLWDSIYKNWSKNPWVWVIEFEKVEKGVQL